MTGAMDKVKMTIDYLLAFCEQLGEKSLFTFNEHAGCLTWGGIASVFICILLMVGLAFFFYKKEKALELCDRNLTYAFIAVWILGFVVYDIGMYPDHSANETNAFFALLGVAPMAIIHAFGMFILQSDVSAIHDGCFNSAWFMFFFSIAHLLAAFISMVFVIKHFGFNIVATFIRIIKTHFWPKTKENLYVFWGMNDATYYLAKDIIQPKDSDRPRPEKDPRIMIIRVNNANEDPNKPIGMDRLFSFLSLSNNNLDKLKELQKLGCLTSSTFGSLTDVQAASNNDLLRSELRLNSVVKLMKRTTGKIHMFFLDDDEAFNLQAIGNLKRDMIIKQFVGEKESIEENKSAEEKELIEENKLAEENKPTEENIPVEEKKIIFYCHARHNSIHRVIEDEPSHKNIEVRVIDSSHLSVEQLKLAENIHLQPVSYVKINDDAAVYSAFNALVVGFSEVGLDMVRFLYEFGAFVKGKDKNENTSETENINKKENIEDNPPVGEDINLEKSKKDNTQEDSVKRSDFHCYVVDKEMKSLAGSFAAKAVAIKPVLDPADEDKAKESLISLYQMDCQSIEFFEQLKKWLPKINYIVLATGDDELNMSQAIRIFKLAIRFETDISKLRIMVRVQHDENGHLNRIASHYNRLWAAECNSTDEEKKMHQKVIKATEEVDGPISLFGSSEMIYTYNHIIDEELKEIAKKFKDKYDKALYEHQEAAGTDPYPIIDWDEQQNDAMQLSDGDYKGFSPTYTGMINLRRTQSQNFANSLHIMTKVKLAQEALKIDKDSCLKDLVREDKNVYNENLKDEERKPIYSCADQTGTPIDKIQRVMDVLAQTEHLRWTASHEIHGYQIDPDNPDNKDEARLLHKFMCKWEKLPPETKSFDYNTVDVSLIEQKLIVPKNIEKNDNTNEQ